MSVQKKTKSRGISLFLILLILSILYFVATAFIFHSGDAPYAPYYSASWFLQNSNAHKPRYPFFNTTLPSNYTNVSNLEYLFEVLSDTRSISWRFFVFSRYIPRVGWVPIQNNVSEYVPAKLSDKNISLLVRTNLIPIDYLNATPLPSLWVPGHNSPICTQFDIYETSIPEIRFSPILYVPDSTIAVAFEYEQSGYVGLQYIATLPLVNYTEFVLNSASIRDTHDRALSNATLSYYLEIPEGYLESYPEVQEFANIVALNDTDSVYAQVTYLLDYLFTRFRVNNNTEFDDDPVAGFIDAQEGPLLSFLNTSALILRILGIPTRIVWGFLGGSYNFDLNITKYSYSDLYAWLEVWDANLGWIPIPTIPLYKQADNYASWLRINLKADTELEGFDVTYLNGTITIRLTLRGKFENLSRSQVTFLDLNESSEIGRVPFIQVDTLTYIATFQFSYLDFYRSLNKTPLYGRHIIIYSLGTLAGYLEVILVRPTSIG